MGDDIKQEFFIYSIISTFIISILILESNVYRPDASLYHLPFINILNEEKIIFGLSNLHLDLHIHQFYNIHQQ